MRWWTGAALVLAALTGACGGGGDAAGPTLAEAADLERGQKLYQQTCAMCHGFRGEGVQRLGKPIVGSRFVRDRSDDELVRFLIEGSDFITGSILTVDGGRLIA